MKSEQGGTLQNREHQVKVWVNRKRASLLHRAGHVLDITAGASNTLW